MAIVVGDAVIKDSDIERDIRIVDFLNHDMLSTNVDARRRAASRLIDQLIIKREIDVGDYQTPAPSEADKLLATTERDRAKSAAAFQNLLSQYGLTRDELKDYFYWQLTVLRFIDQRFRPGIQVTDEDVQKYYSEHATDFKKRKNSREMNLAEATPTIRETLMNDRINSDFDRWLRARRRTTVIQYREATLK